MRRCAPVILGVLLLASCGGSSGGGTSGAAPSASQSASSATAPPASATATVTVTRTAPPSTSDSTTSGSTTSGSTTSGSTTGGSTTGGPGPCVASDLALSFIGQQGATGHGLLGFGLRNTSGQSCRTYGYPGIQFLSSAGQALPTIPTHTTHDFFGTAPLSALVLAPGQAASFRLGVTHGAASPAGCTTAAGLQVIAPNDTATLRTTIPDGAYECRTATVTPLQSGGSAYP